MAKQSQLPQQPTKEKKYPSPYGTHDSMVDEVVTDLLGKPDLVVCGDDEGLYVTEKNRVDNRLADPNRYASSVARDLDGYGLTKEKIAKAREVVE